MGSLIKRSVASDNQLTTILIDPVNKTTVINTVLIDSPLENKIEQQIRENKLRLEDLHRMEELIKYREEIENTRSIRSTNCKAFQEVMNDINHYLDE